MKKYKNITFNAFHKKLNFFQFLKKCPPKIMKNRKNITFNAFHTKLNLKKKI